MGATAERWMTLYGLFNPRRRLGEAEQDLYVSRPGAVADHILRRIPFEPCGKWIIAGTPGSGKSSELVHLGRKVWDEYTVVALDLPPSVAQVNRMTPPEVLFLVGAAAVRRAREGGIGIPDATVAALTSSFTDMLQPDAAERVEPRDLLEGVALFVSNLAAPGSAAVVQAATGAAKMAASVLGGTTRDVREGEAALGRLLAALDAIFAHLANTGPRPLVLIDGLDKVQDHAVIRSLFNSRLLSLPSAAMVFSGPITLMLSAYWKTAGDIFQCERLTNLVVGPSPVARVKVPPDKVEAGKAALREVVGRRLTRLELRIDDVFAPDALDELVVCSGGVLRDLIQLVNRCCPIAHEKAQRDGKAVVDLDVARLAIGEYRKEMEITLTGRRIEELRRVRLNGEPSGEGEESDDLLLTGFILPYANGGVWFEPHPILRGVREGV